MNTQKKFIISTLSYALVFVVLILSLVLSIALDNKKTYATVPDPLIFTKSVTNSTTRAILDWNLLDEQFIDQLGDTMGGDLDMSGNTITGLQDPSVNDEIANKAYADTGIATLSGYAAQDINGVLLPAICGNTHPTNTTWNQFGGYIYTTVDTTGVSGANFLATPIYIFAISGRSPLFRLGQGASAGPPSNSGFEARFDRNGTSAANANGTGEYHVVWCGIGF